MIIGISGKIGSGKDTVGKIIQYLTHQGDNGLIYSPKGFSENLRVYHPNQYIESFGALTGVISDWEIQKYAGALKDIVCLLINCTREQLEDEEFKNKELGEEWKRWYWYKKCRVSEYFSTQEKAERFYDSIDLNNKSSFAYAINQASLKSETLTPRKLFQLIGTECGRQIIHPNIWVNALMSKYKSNIEIKHKLAGENGISDDYEPQENDIIDVYSNWVVTDVRFPNELKAIEDRGGFVIRVTRNKSYGDAQFNGTQEEWKELVERNNRNNEKHQHPSETALDNHPFDLLVNNNGSIEDLVKRIKVILKLKKII